MSSSIVGSLKRLRTGSRAQCFGLLLREGGKLFEGQWLVWGPTCESSSLLSPRDLSLAVRQMISLKVLQLSLTGDSLDNDYDSTAISWHSRYLPGIRDYDLSLIQFDCVYDHQAFVSKTPLMTLPKPPWVKVFWFLPFPASTNLPIWTELAQVISLLNRFQFLT